LTYYGLDLFNVYGQGCNPLENALSQIFGNLRKAFNVPGYTISLEGDQIFPNSTLKQNIVGPSRINATKTRVDIPLMLARNVTVTNGVLNLNYNEVKGSIYGIYDKTTDKMTVHIPLAVASKYMHL
jgi:hypothetical protein